MKWQTYGGGGNKQNGHVPSMQLHVEIEKDIQKDSFFMGHKSY